LNARRLTSAQHSLLARIRGGELELSGRPISDAPFTSPSAERS